MRAAKGNAFKFLFVFTTENEIEQKIFPLNKLRSEELINSPPKNKLESTDHESSLIEVG